MESAIVEICFLNRAFDGSGALGVGFLTRVGSLIRAGSSIHIDRLTALTREWFQAQTRQTSGYTATLHDVRTDCRTFGGPGELEAKSGCSK